MGTVERVHDPNTLYYDVTMRDWRTHEGVDICAALGEEVIASRAGVVESIEEDPFYGVVLTLNHGDGTYSVYANLDAETAVGVGDSVDTGSTIGYVGKTAICETLQEAHLHYAMYTDSGSADPLEYLPKY